MFNAYGIYKKVRNSSWQVLIDNKITDLPVDVIKIAENNNIKILKNSCVNELRKNEYGLSILHENTWFIVYDDVNSSDKKKIRFIIAHELGHIFLGHPLFFGYKTKKIEKTNLNAENEANRFASRLLSPACVLWGT